MMRGIKRNQQFDPEHSFDQQVNRKQRVPSQMTTPWVASIYRGLLHKGNKGLMPRVPQSTE